MMSVSDKGSALICAVLIAASCASPGAGVQRGAIEATRVPTYLHAGFGAGPIVFTDDTGHLVEERRYEPFGAPVDAHQHGGGGDTIGAPDLVARDLNPLNKRSDAATGWSDHGARWLAPETGRWLTPDPAVTGPDAKFMVAPWGLHPYQYADQNPVVYWDPDGRSPAVAAIAQDAPAVPPIIVGVLRFGAAIGGAFVRGLPVVGLIAAPVASVVQHAQHPEDFPLECDGCEIIKLELELQQDAQQEAAGKVQSRVGTATDAATSVGSKYNTRPDATIGIAIPDHGWDAWLTSHGAKSWQDWAGLGLTSLPTWLVQSGLTRGDYDAFQISAQAAASSARTTGIVFQLAGYSLSGPGAVALRNIATFIVGNPALNAKTHWFMGDAPVRYEKADESFYLKGN